MSKGKSHFTSADDEIILNNWLKYNGDTNAIQHEFFKFRPKGAVAHHVDTKGFSNKLYNKGLPSRKEILAKQYVKASFSNEVDHDFKKVKRENSDKNMDEYLSDKHSDEEFNEELDENSNSTETDNDDVHFSHIQYTIPLQSKGAGLKPFVFCYKGGPLNLFYRKPIQASVNIHINDRIVIFMITEKPPTTEEIKNYLFKEDEPPENLMPFLEKEPIPVIENEISIRIPDGFSLSRVRKIENDTFIGISISRQDDDYIVF